MTLCDGTHLPAGTLVAAASYTLHRDETKYPSPDEFDPFRFSRLREGEGQDVKHQFVNTSNDYLLFGHGKHAWYAVDVFSARLRIRCTHVDVLQSRQVLCCKRAEGNTRVHGTSL